VGVAVIAGTILVINTHNTERKTAINSLSFSKPQTKTDRIGVTTII